MWDQCQINDGGDKVANSVSLLQDTTGKSTGFDWQVLKCSGRCEAPDSTHSDAEEGAKSEELLEGLHEAGSEFEDGDEDEIEYERPFPAKTVGENTKQDLEMRYEIGIEGN